MGVLFLGQGSLLIPSRILQLRSIAQRLSSPNVSSEVFDDWQLGRYLHSGVCTVSKIASIDFGDASMSAGLIDD